MQIQIAVAKIEKYASSESGDTLEMVERPGGGLSVVLVDGQRSGKSAKAISNLVAGKAIALLSEGVRDGAVARAVHDYLYMQRNGKVSATLNIVSVDMVTKTLVLSRNSHCPAIVQTAPGVQIILDELTTPLGVQRITRPQISEFPIQIGITAVIFTDGVLTAGQRRGTALDVAQRVDELYCEYEHSGQLAQPLADSLLAAALGLDEGRPLDDISVLVLSVVSGDSDGVRRLQASLPIPPLLRP